jgi:hypothetical protein
MNLKDVMLSSAQIIGMIISFFIIFFSIESSYYGIRYMLTPSSVKSNYRWLYMLVTVVSIIWTVIYSYISIMTGLGHSPVQIDQFGAVFIRPTILMTVMLMSICQRLRYIEANLGEIPKCQLRKTY